VHSKNQPPWRKHPELELTTYVFHGRRAAFTDDVRAPNSSTTDRGAEPTGNGGSSTFGRFSARNAPSAWRLDSRHNAPVLFDREFFVSLSADGQKGFPYNGNARELLCLKRNCLLSWSGPQIRHSP
jgi:hypothetical protein